MKIVKLKIDDPDGFLDRLEYVDEEDHEGFIRLHEGELPPRFPKITYIVDDCETFNSLVEKQKKFERQEGN